MHRLSAPFGGGSSRAERKIWRWDVRRVLPLGVLAGVLMASGLAAIRVGGTPPAAAPPPAAESVIPMAPAMVAAMDERAFQALAPLPVAPVPVPTADAAPAPAALEPAPPVRTHRVEPGESLALVAARYGLRIETLLWANELADPGLLRPDQELRVPAADGVVYPLQPGETLRGVAELAGVPLEAVITANRLADPDRVPVGTELLLPGAAPTAFAPPPESEGVQRAAAVDTAALPLPPKPAPVTYTVQPGDTLAALGRKFGVDLDTLLAANELSDPNTLTVGTTLRILPVSGVEHVVQPGERLVDIAAQYATALGRILEVNALDDPNLVRAGDRLAIPGGRRAAPPMGTPVVAAEPGPQPTPPAAGAAVAPLVQAPAPTTPAPKTPSIKPEPAPAPTPPAAAKPASPAAPVPGTSLGQRIVAEALKYNGYRYTWGGRSPATGFDSSGLPWWVFQQVGLPIPTDKPGQYNAGRHIGQDELQPGDLVFYQNTYMPGLSHNGIYIGNQQFIHAVDESRGVRISSIDTPYWVERWYGATRVGG